MKKPWTVVSIVLPAALFVFLAGAFSSCKKTAEAPNVTEWEIHQDPINGMEVEYPKGWLKNADPKSLRLYSSQVVADKFYEVYSTGSTEVNEDQGGVEVTIAHESFQDAKVGTLEEYKAVTLQNYSALNLANEQPVSVGKESGVSFSYKVKVSKNTTLAGKKIVVAHDSLFYTVSITGFNDYFDAYTAVFDKVIASIKLPKPKIRSMADANAMLRPSKDLEKVTNDYVEFMQPDNFVVTYPAKKAGSLFSMHSEVEEGRKDCTIDLEIFPAKTDKGEVKFERFVEDNKSKFSPKSTTKGKIDGLDATVLTASPAPQIERKVYFVAKGEKYFRIILTWHKSMAPDFQPAFDGVIASLKLK